MSVQDVAGVGLEGRDPRRPALVTPFGTLDAAALLTAVDARAAELRADGVRLLVRPSGTEPKTKLYVHLHQPPDGDDVGGVEADLAARARAALAFAADYLELT